MQCEEAAELLAARIAVEIDDIRHQELARHLAECAECRRTEREWQRDDRQLNRELSPKKHSADHVARLVVSQLPGDGTIVSSSRSVARRRQTAGGRGLTIALATAVGFLLAAIVFRSGNDNQVAGNSFQPVDLQPDPDDAPQADRPASLATLVSVTGPIRLRAADSEHWVDIADASAFTCNPSTQIQTGPDSQCEILTSDGCVLRLNTNTRLEFDSSRRVKIQEGQLWCRSDAVEPLEVVAEAGGESLSTEDSLRVYQCPSGASCLVDVNQQDLLLHASTGSVTLVTPAGSHIVDPGQLVRVSPDGVVQPDRAENALLAAGWMDALLIRKKHADPDLKLRVDALLAQIGRTKASFLYERELRGLGEHCVLPLTRYVQSDLSSQAPGRRLKAMSVLADISPTWNIGNLIELLNDADARIRVLAATTLLRLTGESRGRSPSSWDSVPPGDDEVRDAWNQWWSENQDRYPRLRDSPQLNGLKEAL